MRWIGKQIMVCVSTSLHLTHRPYQLLSEAVAMGNSKAKEQIGYFHLVKIYLVIISYYDNT